LTVAENPPLLETPTGLPLTFTCTLELDAVPETDPAPVSALTVPVSEATPPLEVIEPSETSASTGLVGTAVGPPPWLGPPPGEPAGGIRYGQLWQGGSCANADCTNQAAQAVNTVTTANMMSRLRLRR
jgi:hypothetical protein